MEKMMNHIVTKAEYEEAVMQYRERGWEYLREINDYLKRGSEKDIAAFLRLFADKQFTSKYTVSLPELAHAHIFAVITEEERRRGIFPLFIVHGNTVDELIVCLKQIEFLLWRVEFNSVPDAEQRLYEHLVNRQISAEAMGVIIFVAGMDKKNCYLVLACIYLDHQRLNEAIKLLRYGLEVFPGDETLAGVLTQLQKKNRSGNEQ